MRRLTYVVTHVPMHSIAHTPCTRAGHIPAALSSPPGQLPSSTGDASAQIFSPSPLDLPRAGQNQCSQWDTAPQHWLCTPGDHCSLWWLLPPAAPGPRWRRSALSPLAMGQELPSARPSGCAPTPPRARISAQLPAPPRVRGGVNLDPVLPGMAV